MTRPILSWILRVVCRHCKRSPGLSHSARLAAWLVRAGAEGNCVIDGDGDTPLHVLRDRDTCRLLVERGADVHAPNTRGHTPLHVAARRGATDTAQLLLDHGAAAAARDGGGATPLHHCGDRDTCALLLAAGAELEAADSEGRTPLHSAAWRGQLEVARVLLEAGARVNAANDRGQRPLHLATMRGRRGLVVLLLHRGGGPGQLRRHGPQRLPGQRGVRAAAGARGAGGHQPPRRQHAPAGSLHGPPGHRQGAAAAPGGGQAAYRIVIDFV